MKRIVDDLPTITLYDTINDTKMTRVELLMEFIDFLESPHEYSEIEDDSK